MDVAQLYVMRDQLAEQLDSLRRVTVFSGDAAHVDAITHALVADLQHALARIEQLIELRRRSAVSR
jgi:hypothetical protein